VNHQGTVARLIIEARLQAVHAQRIAMGAQVTFLGTEQAQAGLVAAFTIGELGGEVFPGLRTVGHQVAQHQGLFA